ncbi:MAG: LysM peptidoglycan-binding protein [Pseudonocardiales bacterium]|nr:LysM peptidoglycan-binding protein [Pseudonocardiales bacterium]
MSHGLERAVVAGAWVGALSLRPDIGRLRAIGADPAKALADQGADSAIGDLASAGLWVACVWLALASGAVAAAQLPGLAGVAASALARHVAPRVIRRALAAALGAGIAVIPALAVADPAPGPSVSVAWPLSTEAPSTEAPSSDPTSGAAPAPTWPVGSASDIDLPADQATVGAVDPQFPAPDVLVGPGDTLWSVAATALGPGADPAAIAAAWPQWYRVNAAAIGADPDLIRPGITLHAPALGDQS